MKLTISLFFVYFRIVVAAFITGAGMGIEGHVWYTFLDNFIVQQTWRNVLKKALLDQTVAAPLYLSTYIVGKKKDFYSIQINPWVFDHSLKMFFFSSSFVIHLMCIQIILLFNNAFDFQLKS